MPCLGSDVTGRGEGAALVRGACGVAPLRLVVVSNRLPVAYLSEGGTFTLAPTAGGVSVGLDALRKGRETVRVGWPGRVPHEHERQVAERLKREFACVPVFLPD